MPTVGGLLLFGADHLSHFPDAWIQVGRFAGTDRSHLIDSAAIRTLPIVAINMAIEFVQKHLSKKSEIGAVRRADRWTIPRGGYKSTRSSLTVLPR